MRLKEEAKSTQRIELRRYSNCLMRMVMVRLMKKSSAMDVRKMMSSINSFKMESTNCIKKQARKIIEI